MQTAFISEPVSCHAEAPFPPPSTPIREGVLGAIGQTPLIRLSRYLETEDVELLVKMECCNPGGSAKDRPAQRMIQDAIDCGRLRPGMTVVESSSGNMGIGLAQVCAYHGLKFICVVDPRAQKQNLDIIRALGGQIEMVRHPIRGDLLAARIARVRTLIRNDPECYWPNQYANRQNPKSHFEGTIREIDEALNGNFDDLFVATSSTGTAQGCREYLAQKGRSVRVVAVDAHGSVLFGGTAGRRAIPGLGAGRIPELARQQQFDDVVRVTDLDCVVGCRRAAQREAMLVGGSAGGVLESIRRIADRLRGRRCVAILHDSGTRYLETVFNDQWVQEQLGCSPEDLNELVQQPIVDEVAAA